MERLIFHVDVNSAYLSWEAARRVKNGQPDLRTIPSCIGGSPTSRRGVVLAKSIPAKAYKVSTGEPIASALRKCPELVIAPPDFKLYTQCSRAFKAICREYAPVVEEFSIDECFLDLTGTGALYPDPVALAHEIKDRIRDQLGFTVNVGVGRNKLCAKMASDFEKPDRVHTLFPEEIEAKLWPLPVGDLLFIGGASVKKLRQAHIDTVGALAHTDPAVLTHILGNKASLQAHRYANGLDDSPVRAEPEAAKGYSNSVTLEDDVADLTTANAVLLSLADSVSAHMRSDGVKATNVSVSIRYLDFKTRSHQRKLPEPIDTTRAVYETARELLAELWRDRRPLRLLGVALTDLTREGQEQISLFDQEDAGRQRDRQLDQTVDALRGRFGTDIIRRGSVVKSGVRVAKKFKGQQDADQRES